MLRHSRACSLVMVRRSWVGFKFETWQADLQAKDHQYFCLKLKKNEEAFLESVIKPRLLSFLQEQ